MYPRDYVYFILLSTAVLISPLLPTNVLLLLDTLLVRISIVILLLFLVGMSPLVGIFGMIALGVLFIERNRRKVSHALKKLDHLDVHAPNYATVEEASKPQTTVPVRSFDEPEEEEFSFLPKEEAFNDLHFDPASINEKGPLATIYPPSERGSPAHSANELYEQMGAGHVPGVETLGNSS